MNDRDKENLKFLLSSKPSVISEWFERMSEDDHDYAQDIMDLYEDELNKREREVDLKLELLTNERLELELEMMGEEYKGAKRVLKKIMAKK